MNRIVEPEVMDTVEAAEAYDAMEHGEVDHAFVDRVVALGANTGHFLDVGTGPAQIPILLAQHCPDIHITAIDLSEEMLKIAKRHVADAGLTDRITLEHVDAKVLPYPDNTFDGLISNSIVHHIHDTMKALQEMGRVVRPKGTVLIRDLIRYRNASRRTSLCRSVCRGRHALSTEVVLRLLPRCFHHSRSQSDADANGQCPMPWSSKVQIATGRLSVLYDCLNRHWQLALLVL